jgi:hypothetical protein
MPLCHQCGREIPGKTGVYRTMKTGRYSGGSDFHRSVSVCPRCAEALEKSEQEAKGKRSTFVLIVGVLGVAAVLYLLYFK